MTEIKCDTLKNVHEWKEVFRKNYALTPNDSYFDKIFTVKERMKMPNLALEEKTSLNDKFEDIKYYGGYCG